MKFATRKKRKNARRRKNQEAGDVLELPVGVPISCDSVTLDSTGRLTGIELTDDAMTVAATSNPQRRVVKVKRRRK